TAPLWRSARPARPSPRTATTTARTTIRSKQVAPNGAAPSSGIRADQLDAFVFDQVRAAMLRPELLTAGEAALASREPAPDDELLASQLARLDRQLDTVGGERRRLVDCYQTGFIELAQLTRRAEELK